MHELSIAMSLVEIAADEAAKLGASRVIAVQVRVGALSGVVPDALAFCWEMASADSPIAGARLQIDEVPVTIHCDACNAERALASPQHLRCPSCGAPALKITAGRDLALTALEISDDHVGAHR